MKRWLCATSGILFMLALGGCGSKNESQKDSTGQDAVNADGTEDTANPGDLAEKDSAAPDKVAEDFGQEDLAEDTNPPEDLAQDDTDIQADLGADTPKPCDGCLIDGECIPAGTASEEGACAVCNPDAEDSAWSAAPQGTACRPSVGDCDAEETCDGTALECPVDSKRGDASLCRPPVGPCDLPETCDGLSDQCPEDAVAPDQEACGTCGLCDGLAKECQPLSSDEGPNCQTGCSKCDAGACVARDDTAECGERMECAAGSVGECACIVGFVGEACDSCADGYFNYPECQLKTMASPGFVAVTSGSFWVGSPDGDCPAGYPGVCIVEPGRIETSPPSEELYPVILTNNFEISRFETTQGEFEDAMWFNPSLFGPWRAPYYEVEPCGLDCPVEHVGWVDAVAYANERSWLAGLQECYVISNVLCMDGTEVGDYYYDCLTEAHWGIDEATVELAPGLNSPYECEGYRLPSSAEWEYAARSGKEYTALYTSDGNNGTFEVGVHPHPNLIQIAWYDDNSEGMTHPVGLLEPNSLGIYDMLGNVYEYAGDFFQYTPEPDLWPLVDPVGGSFHKSRVIRGGGYNTDPRQVRIAADDAIEQSGGGASWFGIRLARTLHKNPCFDGVQNNDETDTDCGGSVCAKCEAGESCAEASDCASLICAEGNLCAEATCDDGVLNQDEADIDCGGSCPTCTGGSCSSNDAAGDAECKSNACVNLVCDDTPANYCEDGRQNGFEWGVDCGVDCGHSCHYVAIPAGSFYMGSTGPGYPEPVCPEGYPGVCAPEPGSSYDEGLHLVTLTYAFEMDMYETTQKDFMWLTGFNPATNNCNQTNCGDELPVPYVNWFDAVAYANELSRAAGLPPCYVITQATCMFGTMAVEDYRECWGEDVGLRGVYWAQVALADGLSIPQECLGYRLPTEAEWEYAARATNNYTPVYQSTSSNGNWTVENLNAIAWWQGNAGMGTRLGGQKEPNALLLYDMLGSQSEFVWDWYAPYPSTPVVDPVGPDHATYSGEEGMIYRGGSGMAPSEKVRLASRNDGYISYSGIDFGIRLVRTLHPDSDQ